jgi:transcriptional regulator with XRE-family HTH domain
MDLGSRIAAWRVWMGWTQAQLAERTGLSRASICQYEGAGKHKSDPSQAALNKIVAAFGLTMTEFYGEIPKPKKPAKTTKRAVA